MAPYSNEPKSHPCNESCGYHTSSGCMYPESRRVNAERPPIPDDGICIFPHVHEPVVLRLTTETRTERRRRRAVSQ